MRRRSAIEPIIVLKMIKPAMARGIATCPAPLTLDRLLATTMRTPSSYPANMATDLVNGMLGEAPTFMFL